MKITQIAVVAAFVTLALTGCATSQTASDYTGGTTMLNMAVDTGTVISIKPVHIHHQSSGAGVGIGAVAGGIVGSFLGNGAGHIVGALAGAAAGGIAGEIADKSVNEANGLEIVYKDDQDGKMHAVVQEIDPKAPITVGMQIRILTAAGIQTRVEAL